eukprot:scaffold14217_cov120-Isochrysis_galbana.AAC.3
MRPHQAHPSAVRLTPMHVTRLPSAGAAASLDPAHRTHLRFAMRQELIPVELHRPLRLHHRRELRPRHHLLPLLWRVLRRPSHHGGRANAGHLPSAHRLHAAVPL